jgi:chromosome segregation ATPase
VEEGHTSSNRVSVYQAAEIMGVTVDAIRKRVSRGTISHERDEDGRVWVALDTDQDAASKVRDADQPQSASDALISEMRNRIAFLEQEMEAWREESRRKDTIIMNMTEAMKALNPPAPEASSEARESDVSPGPIGELGELREELDAERTRREMAESTLREGMAEEQRRREEAERERDDLRRELFPPGEARESPQTAREEPARAEPRPDRVEAQEGAQRPWWRRMFGG